MHDALSHFSRLIILTAPSEVVDPFPQFEHSLFMLKYEAEHHLHFDSFKAILALEQLEKACAIYSPDRLQPFDAFLMMRFHFGLPALTLQVAEAMLHGFSQQNSLRFQGWLERFRYKTVTGAPLTLEPGSPMELSEALRFSYQRFLAEEERDEIGNALPPLSRHSEHQHSYHQRADSPLWL